MDNKAQLDEFQQLLAQRAGLRIPPSAHDRFVGTLHERAARLGFATLEEYRIFLAGNNAGAEWEEFVRALTSVETFFFRDNGQFDLLRLRLLPELIARHRHDKTLRLWSAGCASGEEAYSLAMLVDMLLPERGDWNIFILGTDIDSMSIAKARQGRYGQWSFRMVPATLQQRYFHPQGSEWLLDERIRRMVTFRVGNLLGDAFPDCGSTHYPETEQHGMDLVLCRNVFIYFDPLAVSAVAAKLATALVEGGYLMTAHTELIGHPLQGLDSRLFAEGMVHQRRANLPAYSISNSKPQQIVLSEPTLVRDKLEHDRKAAPTAIIPGDKTRLKETQTPSLAIALYASARSHADRGEYELAEQMCRKALTADPSAAATYFLLAQLAQLSGNFNQAKEYLKKTLYLDHRFVAAYLELAALHERAGETHHAQTLRHSAFGVVRSMPSDEQIEQYESTAGELAQWLAQWEPLANNHGSADENHKWEAQHGQ